MCFHFFFDSEFARFFPTHTFSIIPLAINDSAAWKLWYQTLNWRKKIIVFDECIKCDMQITSSMFLSPTLAFVVRMYFSVDMCMNKQEGTRLQWLITYRSIACHWQSSRGFYESSSFIFTLNWAIIFFFWKYKINDWALRKLEVWGISMQSQNIPICYRRFIGTTWRLAFYLICVKVVCRFYKNYWKKVFCHCRPLLISLFCDIHKDAYDELRFRF